VFELRVEGVGRGRKSVGGRGVQSRSGPLHSREAAARLRHQGNDGDGGSEDVQGGPPVVRRTDNVAVVVRKGYGATSVQLLTDRLKLVHSPNYR
jgi:hypothetical protein